MLSPAIPSLHLDHDPTALTPRWHAVTKAVLKYAVLAVGTVVFACFILHYLFPRRL